MSVHSEGILGRRHDMRQADAAKGVLPEFIDIALC